MTARLGLQPRSKSSCGQSPGPPTPAPRRARASPRPPAAPAIARRRDADTDLPNRGRRAIAFLYADQDDHSLSALLPEASSPGARSKTGAARSPT